MSNIMNYKDYVAKVSYDNEAKLFHGRVIGMIDIVTFQGRSVDELEKALGDSVEDYLEMCRADGTPPNKSFSGKFPVRTSPKLHSLIYTTSKILDISMGDTVALMTEFLMSGQNTEDPQRLASVLSDFKSGHMRKTKSGT
jgi:predicted HicB family RNase H-like nuclease